MPTTVPDITRKHIEPYISHVLEVSKPWTALTRYRDLQQFFRWQLEEELIDKSPMRNMRKPKLSEVPVPVVPVEDMRKLLKVCSGKSFEDRRDTALFYVFIDTRISQMVKRRYREAGIDVINVHRFRHSFAHAWLAAGGSEGDGTNDACLVPV
jgi:site-specific recombinase XerD